MSIIQTPRTGVQFFVAVQRGIQIDYSSHFDEEHFDEYRFDEVPQITIMDVTTEDNV